MPKPPTEDLETFLRHQTPGNLVDVLLELAKDHEAVQSRLVRMQLADRPDQLAAGFKKALTSWRRSTKFYGYREAGEFGRRLRARRRRSRRRSRQRARTRPHPPR